MRGGTTGATAAGRSSGSTDGTTTGCGGAGRMAGAGRTVAAGVRGAEPWAVGATPRARFSLVRRSSAISLNAASRARLAGSATTDGEVAWGAEA